PPMNRRIFLSRSATALATSVAGAGLLTRVTQGAGAAAPRRLKRVGLELYSVRDAMKRDPERTLAAVRSMGYRDVELLWSLGNFGRSPKRVKITLDSEGLRAPSAHIDAKMLGEGWEHALDDAHLLGHQYLIVPSLPNESRQTIDGWRAWADRFNAAGEKARKANIWLAFHNEPDHMTPIGGVVPYDVFVDRTSPNEVRHQFDIGNMVMGGGDPMAYLKKYGPRYWSFHVKDVVADHTHDTELGDGTVALRDLLAAITDIDQKPVYVEQEGATDSLLSVKRDYDFLAALEF
ncbi:MAG: sugar phosphate isomerase/epimerase, partial [Gemmatimonadaceae bacterium]